MKTSNRPFASIKPLSATVGLLFGLLAGAQASPTLIAIGTFNNTTDYSTQTNLLENGVDSNNTFGGIGSGLTWAGGSTFLAVPDRGPNATTWNTTVDNTTSYTSRIETLDLALTHTANGSLPYTLTPTLSATTLLYSTTALNYGGVTPSANSSGQYFFNGRSDNFGSGTSLNTNNARLDPEAIRVSADGQSAFIADEYGPYVYKFDRATGQRTAVYNLPSYYGIANLSPTGATEISGNTSGRVTNKGMEGLAISPDGSTLFGFMQSPLAQDGGDGAANNRIISIDVASGTTHEYVYNNTITVNGTGTNYNSSELLAINSHEFLVLERDGKGLGSSNSGGNQTSVLKSLYKIDLAGATDISALNGGAGISGNSTLAAYAVSKSLFLDIKSTLVNSGLFTNSTIPPKLEGAAFGLDLANGDHTLYIGNDNDFVPATAGLSKVFVFSFTDADLGGSTLVPQTVPEPSTWAMLVLGAAVLFAAPSLRRRHS